MASCSSTRTQKRNRSRHQRSIPTLVRWWISLATALRRSEGGVMQAEAEVTAPSLYISPNEMAERWQCSRSSVDRIARRASLARVCLGEGKNGMVRYIRKEVE